MILKEVNDKQTAKQFLEVPRLVYKNDSNWIPHLRQDIEKIFDEKRNKVFRHGEATRFVLFNDAGSAIGRIAVFINQKYSKGMKQPTGGLGFFECIDDKTAAHMLLGKAIEWLKERGIQVVDGPINFGEKDQFWGLLTKNFMSQSSYGMNYNPPYYQAFFEDFGFQTYYEQLVFYRDLSIPAQEVFARKWSQLSATGEYRVTNVRGWSDQKIAESFCTVYNNAWGGFPGFKKMPIKQAQNIVKALKPVMDRDIVVFAFHHEKPIGFYINIPELNDIFKFVNGNLNWLGKLKFLYHKWKKTPKTMVGIVFGVDRAYHNQGIDGALIVYAGDKIRGLNRYDDTVLTWIGDFNPKMLSVAEKLGASVYRKLRTYRFMIDSSIPFERMSNVQ